MIQDFLGCIKKAGNIQQVYDSDFSSQT